MRKPATIEVAGARVQFRTHALDRYIERVKPALDRRAAFEDLRHVLPQASLVDAPPEWSHPRLDGGGLVEAAECWLLIGDDVAVALEEIEPGLFMAVTCVTSTGLSDIARTRRNRSRDRGNHHGQRDIEPRKDRRAWRAEVDEELAA